MAWSGPRANTRPVSHHHGRTRLSRRSHTLRAGIAAAAKAGDAPDEGEAPSPAEAPRASVAESAAESTGMPSPPGRTTPSPMYAASSTGIAGGDDPAS